MITSNPILSQNVLFHFQKTYFNSEVFTASMTYPLYILLFLWLFWILISRIFFPGCDITHQEDEDSAKSLNSNDNQASSSMMEETTNENDLQVSLKKNYAFYF